MEDSTRSRGNLITTDITAIDLTCGDAVKLAGLFTVRTVYFSGIVLLA